MNTIIQLPNHSALRNSYTKQVRMYRQRIRFVKKSPVRRLHRIIETLKRPKTIVVQSIILAFIFIVTGILATQWLNYAIIGVILSYFTLFVCYRQAVSVIAKQDYLIQVYTLQHQERLAKLITHSIHDANEQWIDLLLLTYPPMKDYQQIKATHHLMNYFMANMMTPLANELQSSFRCPTYSELFDMSLVSDEATHELVHYDESRNVLILYPLMVLYQLLQDTQSIQKGLPPSLQEYQLYTRVRQCLSATQLLIDFSFYSDITEQPEFKVPFVVTIKPKVLEFEPKIDTIFTIKWFALTRKDILLTPKEGGDV